MPETLALTVEGVAIAIDDAATISQGLSMLQEDLGKYQENKGKEKDAEGVPELKGENKTVRPESAVTGSKKHEVKWKEGAARAKETGKPQGQWAQSIVHLPDGTTQPATRMWIRNNGTGTWHGYPMQ